MTKDRNRDSTIATLWIERDKTNQMLISRIQACRNTTEKEQEECYIGIMHDIIKNTKYNFEIGKNLRIFDEKTVFGAIDQVILELSTKKLRKIVDNFLIFNYTPENIEKVLIVPIFEMIEDVYRTALTDMYDFALVMKNYTNNPNVTKTYAKLEIQYRRIKAFKSNDMQMILYQQLKDFNNLFNCFMKHSVNKYELEDLYEKKWNGEFYIERGIRVLIEGKNRMNKFLQIKGLTTLDASNNLANEENVDIRVILAMYMHWDKILEIEEGFGSCFDMDGLDSLFPLYNSSKKRFEDQIQEISKKVSKKTGFKCFVNEKKLTHMLRNSQSQINPEIHKNLKTHVANFLHNIGMFFNCSKTKKAMDLMNALEEETIWELIHKWSNEFKESVCFQYFHTKNYLMVNIIKPVVAFIIELILYICLVSYVGLAIGCLFCFYIIMKLIMIQANFLGISKCSNLFIWLSRITNICSKHIRKLLPEIFEYSGAKELLFNSYTSGKDKLIEIGKSTISFIANPIHAVLRYVKPA